MTTSTADRGITVAGNLEEMACRASLLARKRVADTANVREEAALWSSVADAFAQSAKKLERLGDSIRSRRGVETPIVLKRLRRQLQATSYAQGPGSALM